MINWPWVSRKRYETLVAEWNAMSSMLGDIESIERLISAQLDTANARLSRIAALETPNAAHGVRKAAKIARGEL